MKVLFLPPLRRKDQAPPLSLLQYHYNKSMQECQATVSFSDILNKKMAEPRLVILFAM